MNKENGGKLSSVNEDVVIKSSDTELNMINSWGNPVFNVTRGFIIVVVTFNFLGLQYILPTIGIGLMYVGFRQLREENKYFNLGWKLSIVNLVMRAGSLVLVATPWLPTIRNSVVLGICSMAFQVVIILIFRKGLNELYKKTNVKQKRDSILLAVVWYIILILIVMFLGEMGAIVFLFAIFGYVMFVKFLCEAGDELKISCLSVKPQVKFSNRKVVLGYSGICLLLVLFSSFIVNHDVPKFKEVMPITDSDTRNELIELGFPKDILNDISDENVAMLDGAIYVDVSSELLMFDGVEKEIEVRKNYYERIEEPRNRTIEANAIYVELPGNTLYIIEHFEWQKSKAFWNDGFTIWAKGNKNGIELLDGRLLYTKGDMEYEASIPRLKCDFITVNNMFFGESSYKNISGGVCYPFASESQRGYIFYRMQSECVGWGGASCFNYYHTSSIINMPFLYGEQRAPYIGNNVEQHYDNFDLNGESDRD